MPRKKSQPPVSPNPKPVEPVPSSKDDGLEKLKAMSIPVSVTEPGKEGADSAGKTAAAATGNDGGPAAPLVSGIVKQVYPFACDLLCHVFGKEPMSKDEKTELVDVLSPDLDAIDAKWLTPLVGKQSEAKVITVTGIAVVSRKNKPKELKKPEDSPAKPEVRAVTAGLAPEPAPVLSPALAPINPEGAPKPPGAA